MKVYNYFLRFNISKGWGQIVVDLNEFLREKNFDIEPELDGELKRFDRDGTLNGWFIGRTFPRETGEEFIIASLGDWRTGERFDYQTEVKNYTAEEKKLIKEKLKLAHDKAEAVKEEAQAAAANNSAKRWEELAANKISPYLAKKQVENFGCRVGNSSWGSTDLYVPCRDISGKLWGLQKIQEDGQKFFTPGQRIQGCFHQIGEINEHTRQIYLAEGYATATSIHMAIRQPTIVSFNATNLSHVGEKLRKKYPHLPITICGDDDRWTLKAGEPYNPGRVEAQRGASQCAGQALFPHFASLDSKPTDFNDLHCLEGLEVVAKQLEKIKPLSPDKIIKTQGSGFHTVKLVRGNPIKIPCYDDLLKYFEQQTNYKLLNNSGICYTWNGKFYEEYPYLRNFAHENFVPIADNRMANEFKELVLRSKIVPMTWWDESTKMKVNFQNGVYCHTKKSFRAHDLEIGFRYVLNYEFDQKADCPLFKKFLSDIFSKDEDLSQLVCEFLGYAMSNDDYWEHKALVLEGEGANGKSTLMNVAKALAGHGNYAALSMADIRDDKKRQILDGKLFNMSEETPTKALLESSLFKNISGGGETTVRKLYQNAYTMKNRAKIMFACNELPLATDVTYGFTRRLILVPFKETFSTQKGNKDPYIEEKLKKELPGIFNYVMAAYTKMKATGHFSKSKAAEDHLAAYKSEIDFTTTWLKTNLQIHPLGNGHDDKATKIHEIWSSYKQEIEQGNMKPLDRNHFGKRLAKFIGDYEIRLGWKRISNKNERVLKALTIESGDQF